MASRYNRQLQREEGNRKGVLGGYDPEKQYYRRDLGFAANEAQYKGILKGEEEFQSGYKERQGIIDAATTELDTGLKDSLKGLPAAEKMANDSWETTKRSFKPVKVVNGGSIEATYMMPPEMVDKLNTDAFNKGEGSYVGTWHKADGSAATDASEREYYSVDVKPMGVSSGYGKELHESLKDANEKYQKQYMTEALAKSRDVYTQSAAAIQQAYDTQMEDIFEAQGILYKTKADREAEYNKYKNAFTRQIEGMRNFLEGAK